MITGAKTIEQYKVLQYIQNNFVAEEMQIEMVDWNSVRVTDINNSSIVLCYLNGNIVEDN